MNFSWEYFFELFVKLPAYIPVTIFIALISMILAILIGLFITWLQLSKNKVLIFISQVYISLFRGMPRLFNCSLFFMVCLNYFLLSKGCRH